MTGKWSLLLVGAAFIIATAASASQPTCSLHLLNGGEMPSHWRELELDPRLEFEAFIPIVLDPRSSKGYYEGSLRYEPTLIPDFVLGGATRWAEGMHPGKTDLLANLRYDRTHLRANVAYYALSKDSPAYLKGIRPIVQEVYSEFEKRKIIPSPEIQKMVGLVNDFDEARTSFFVFRDRKSRALKAAIILYDGSPVPGSYRDKKSASNSNPPSREILPEKLFRSLKLPERELTGDAAKIYYLGTLWVAPDIVNGVRPLMRRVADYIRLTNGFPHDDIQGGSIYILANAAGVRLYTHKNPSIGYGFEIYKTPEQLGISEGETEEWVLKTSLKSFVEYSSLQSIDPYLRARIVD